MHAIIVIYFSAPREISNEQITTPISSQIIITWDLPSARNGTFLLSLTYKGVQKFNPTQSHHGSTILSGTTTSYVINNALPFANYVVIIRAYNEQFGLSLFSNNVTLSILTSPTREI